VSAGVGKVLVPGTHGSPMLHPKGAQMIESLVWFAFQIFCLCLPLDAYSRSCQIPFLIVWLILVVCLSLAVLPSRFVSQAHFCFTPSFSTQFHSSHPSFPCSNVNVSTLHSPTGPGGLQVDCINMGCWAIAGYRGLGLTRT
jgi:hypothetical protein